MTCQSQERFAETPPNNQSLEDFWTSRFSNSLDFIDIDSRNWKREEISIAWHSRYKQHLNYTQILLWGHSCEDQVSFYPKNNKYEYLKWISSQSLTEFLMKEDISLVKKNKNFVHVRRSVSMCGQLICNFTFICYVVREM